jgi:uncharacterized protein (DUF362 family)
VRASAGVTARGASARAAVAASSEAGGAEPENGGLAAGPVDGASLRAERAERLARDRSAVTVLQGSNAFDLGRRICEAVVPRRPSATPVLLQPNICDFDGLKEPSKTGGDNGASGRGTDPEFVRGVIRCLKARGHGEITVAQGCGHSHETFRDLTHVTGYVAMTQAEGARLVGLEDDGVFDVEGDRPGEPLPVSGMDQSRVPALRLPRILADHLRRGLVLSLPKVKAHPVAVVSMGIHGAAGNAMLADKLPARRHRSRLSPELADWVMRRANTKRDDRPAYVAALRAFAERLLDVLEVSAPDAVLAEGAPAMSGDGFRRLRPSAEKVAIGGTNVVSVDKVGAQFLGLWNSAQLAAHLGGHRTSPLIELGAKRYALDLDAVPLAGDGAGLVKAPRPVHFEAMAPFRIDVDPPGATPPAAAPDWASYPAFAKPATGDEELEHPLRADDPPPRVPSAAAEAHAARLLRGEVIQLDGVSDEAVWARAKAISWSTDPSGSETPFETTVRFAWSASALYALFELGYLGFHADTSKPVEVEREGLLKEDCVKLLITPDPGRPARSFEIALGPFGHFLDAEVDRAGRRDARWSSGAKIGTLRDPSTHTAAIEVELASADIAKALAAGARLPLGLSRVEGAVRRHHLTWRPGDPAAKAKARPELAGLGALVLDP